MKPILGAALAAVAAASLTACGSGTSASGPSSAPVATSTPRPTVLPTLGAVPSDARVLVATTHATGGRVLTGAAYGGKELYVEIACLGPGAYHVFYAGGSFSSACTGELGMVGDAAVDFKVGAETSFTVQSSSPWVFRATEQK